LAPSGVENEREGAVAPREEAQRKRFGLEGSRDPELEVTLATVKEGGDGKLVLTTTDGAVWRQVESEPVRPTPAQGQTMTITKGSLGSYLCKPGKWVGFRCARVR